MMLLSDDEIGYYEYILNLNHKDFYEGSRLWRIDLTVTKEAWMAQWQSKNDTILHLKEKLSRYFDEVPDPLDVFVRKWRRNKFTNGAYTSYGVGFTDDDVDKIEHVWYENVYFAGDGLSGKYDGYVHGAYDQGMKMGKKLVERIKKEMKEAN